MPRLTPALSGENRARIEDAALRCFLRQGFHGTSTREIAEEAGISLGNLYTYFPDKVSLFRALLKKEETAFVAPDNPVIRYFLESEFPSDLGRLAAAIGGNVDRFADYFKLIYIDVIEFNGTHIRDFFSDLDQKFELLLQSNANAAKEARKLRKGLKPSFAATAIYLGLYQYFTLTKLFGARNLLGKGSDERVVRELIQVFAKGILADA